MSAITLFSISFMKKALSILFIIVPFLAFSQAVQNVTGDAIIPSIAAKLDTYNANHSVEKAYLQFDKPYYAIGDTIYFKAYLTLGAAHKLSALSGILYVDLINPDNNISRSIKLPVAAGTAHGDFMLSDTLKAGNYRIRAYTTWMRNTGIESFFSQVIPVGKVAAANAASQPGGFTEKKITTGKQPKIDIQFFPEGGSLIAGNYSKVAFKAIMPNGAGVSIKGTITDNENNEVTTFESAHLGMGSFVIVPGAGKTYKANIILADGTTQTIDLPKAINTGYTINLNNTDADTIKLRITAGSESPKDNLNVVAQCGGIVCYAVQSGHFDKFFNLKIAKNKFSDGIVQFTLFSSTGEPLNERLAFVNNKNQLNLNIKTKEVYSVRQKAEVELTTVNKDNKIAPGSFSVAVTDETLVPVDEQNENTILSSLLLTSELKGTVEKPGYYFANESEQTHTDLDLLMLTQGYRQFEWKKILNDKPQTVLYKPEQNMQISGRVVKWSKPAAGAKITLFSNKGGLFMIDTVADKNGLFAFKDLVFADSTNFVVQSRIKKGQDAVTLYLDTIMPPGLPVKNKHNTDLNPITTNMSALLANQKRYNEEQIKNGHVVLLKEVIIKSKYELAIPHSRNLNGVGNADYVFTAKDIEKFICSRLADCLSGRIPRVRFANGIPVGMALVIDGTFMDVDNFAFLNPDDIEGIEVITGPHYGGVYGSEMANGGFIVTTKAGRRGNEYYRYAPGVLTYHPQGFYKVREFYSPQYDKPNANSQITDLRSTIFWKPDIITDKDGKASFSYFNADGKGTYRIVIEGIDADGNLGRQVVRYKVE